MLTQIGRVLIIAASQHTALLASLIEVASKELTNKHIGFDIVRVSRVHEIAATTSIMLEGNDYTGVVVLGSVILEDYKLESPYIYTESLRGMTDIVMYYSIPLGMGIFMAENLDEAMALSEKNTKNAIEACLELLFLKNQFDDFKNDKSFSQN